MRGLGQFEEGEAGELVTGGDFEGHVVFHGGVDDVLHAPWCPKPVVIVGEGLWQPSSVGENVHRFAAEDLDMPIDVAVHELIRIGQPDPFEGVAFPELDPLAVGRREGHGIGEDVIELRQGRLGETAHPISPFGLHAAINGFACQGRQPGFKFGVAAQDGGVLVLLRARVFDNAEPDVAGLRQGEGFVDGAVVQVHVKIDQREIARDRRGRRVGFRCVRPGQENEGGEGGQVAEEAAAVRPLRHSADRLQERAATAMQKEKATAIARSARRSTQSQFVRER